MSHSQATYEDVNLILRLYEMRREEKMRAARAWFSAPTERFMVSPQGAGPAWVHFSKSCGLPLRAAHGRRRSCIHSRVIATKTPTRTVWSLARGERFTLRHAEWDSMVVCQKEKRSP